MFFKLDSFCLIGIQAVKVSVEVHISNGLPSFIIVGLPDKAVNEARLRVRAAIINSGFKFPNKKIIVNLSPADIKKEGVLYDFPIALALLAACGNPGNFETGLIKKSCFIGELSLNGNINPVNGIISMVEEAAFINKNYFFLPEKNCDQAIVIKGIKIIGCNNLHKAVNIISGGLSIEENIISNNSYSFVSKINNKNRDFDFSDIKGQLRAKRAVEIAVSGMHNIMLIGPPGAGKTMLARRITGIMPDLSIQESIEVTKIHSLLKNHYNSLIFKRPFRSPHHTITKSNLIGGGLVPRPGEISLAHRGVLFLDEFPQFKRNIIEDLRQPLENREISIARNNLFYVFPCSFILIVAANPCRCGYLGDSKKRCRCSPGDIKRYWDNISGPIMDRIDIRIELPRLDNDDFVSDKSYEGSEAIKERVIACQKIQATRYSDKKIKYNSEADFKNIGRWIKGNRKIENLIPRILDRYCLSGRGFMSLIRVSRTIADMERSEKIKVSNIMEALNYRISFDHEFFE